MDLLSAASLRKQHVHSTTSVASFLRQHQCPPKVFYATSFFVSHPDSVVDCSPPSKATTLLPRMMENNLPPSTDETQKMTLRKRPSEGIQSNAAAKRKPRTSSNEHAASSKKPRTKDPLSILLKVPTKKAVANRIGKLTKEQQAMYDQVFSAAYRNQAVQAKIGELLELSSEVAMGSEYSELEVFFAAVQGEFIDQGTLSEELRIIYQLGHSPIVNEIIDKLPVLLHQEEIYVVSSWTKNGGNAGTVSGLMIKQNQLGMSRIISLLLHDEYPIS